MLVMFMSRKFGLSPAAAENIILAVCVAFLAGVGLGYWVFK